MLGAEQSICGNLRAMVEQAGKPHEKDSASAPMLAATDLYCERDDRILFEKLNFQLQEGQVLQIKGDNGSGKTTLLRMLCGLNDSYEGELSWYGQPMSECADAFYDALLYIGHRVGVNKILTPRENLAWSCGLRRQVRNDEIDSALLKVGLRGFEDSQCFTLSAGQHQRVSLARLLVSDARLWVLDEPFTTLDVTGVALLEKLIRDYSSQGGAVLVTTHHPLSVNDLTQLTLGRRLEAAENWA